ncbi:MAG: hypothetical protein JWM80_5971 [Cyanobacteria bacterium RYN_339]|nr:hypothetical protein [Cyanobacteria bacterium RYN_339]
MKSLILAILLFAVVVYGCYDVKPFRNIRRVIRRVPGGKTGSLRQQTGPLEEEEAPLAAGSGPLRRRR